jgi:hypothetical protein
MIGGPSARASEEAAAKFEQLHEGIPSHLVESLKYWLLTESLELPAGLPSTSEEEDEPRLIRRAEGRLVVLAQVLTRSPIGLGSKE